MINSLYDFEKLIKVNGPAHRGARMPAAVDVAINQSKMPDNMRPKHYQVDILDENSIQLYWQTQEPFTTEDAEKALNEVKRAINAIVKANDYTEHINVHVTFECRDGADEGYEDFTFTINDEIKKENINIRESLNRLDAATCNDYDLLNTYNSVALNEERKATLAKMLKEHADAKKIARFLINESQSKDLKESLNESDDFDWSIYDDYGYDDYEDDWDHANTYGGDLTDCPICGRRLSYDDDGDTYCDNCGEDAHTLAMQRRARDKKLNEDEIYSGQSSHAGADVKNAASNVINAIADEKDQNTQLKQVATLVDSIPDEKADEVVDTIKELFGELKLNAEARKKAKEAGLEPDRLESIGDICDFILVKFDDQKLTGGIKTFIMILVQVVATIVGIADGPLPIAEGIGALINAIIALIPSTLLVKIAGLSIFAPALVGSKIVRGAQAKKKAKATQASDVKENFLYEDNNTPELDTEKTANVIADKIDSAPNNTERAAMIKNIINNVPKDKVKEVTDTLVKNIDDKGLTDKDKEILKAKTNINPKLIDNADTLLTLIDGILATAQVGLPILGVIIDVVHLIVPDEAIAAAFPPLGIILAVLSYLPEGTIISILGSLGITAIRSLIKAGKNAIVNTVDSRQAKNKAANEAFSYEDSEFFTREEVDDFAEKVCEHVNETFYERFKVQESYITNNEIEVVVYNDDLGEFTGKKKVDMRRIRKPSDLDKYVLDIAANIIADIKKVKGIDKSLDEDSETTNNGFTIENGVLVEYKGEDQHVTIPRNVTKIGDGAFYGALELESVTIPDTVTHIGDHAFALCTSLTRIVIPDSVTYIGSYAFEECEFLTSIKIPNSVKSIEKNTFFDCDSLERITMGNSIVSIGDSAFQYCNSLTNIKIPTSVKTIGEHAFDDCTSLTSIVIPDSVLEIGKNAFLACESLKSVTIGNNVKVIGDYAFYWCSSLTNIKIPDAVVSIGSHAFEHCDALTIYCEAAEQPKGWSKDWNLSDCPVVWGYNKSNLTEDSDDDGPYSYEETEAELQLLTQNWTIEKDQLKCGYDEEKNYGMEILSKHGYECKADRQGGWWVVDYWKQPIKENKSDIIDSQNEEITFDVLDENEELIKTFSGRDYDKLIEFVNTNPDAYFVEKHEPVEIDGFGYEEPEMQVSSYYVFDRSEDDSLTYQMLRECLKEAWTWEPEFKTEDGWTEEDIAKWKEIDWEPLLKQHIGEVTVPEDNFLGKAVLYGDGYKPQYKQVKFVKKLHSNPIYPPNYEPEENPFPEHCGPMYDGTKRNGLMVHDRYETWANYDMLSK